ncbi:hypothetical protein ACFWIA_20545 [Streptomyces sp. NPDC127068]|uniref:hypothetical protein n=1 Tax=Streptomyces sp. NPDC127068 TaxID=3347127 RepID=UPI00365F4A1C
MTRTRVGGRRATTPTRHHGQGTRWQFDEGDAVMRAVDSTQPMSKVSIPENATVPPEHSRFSVGINWSCSPIG